MSILSDQQISAYIAGSNPLCTNVDADDFGHKDSQIQPASLDLTIGNIYIPGKTKKDVGSIACPAGRVALKEGETAVIETGECLALPPTIAAVGYPPASISLAGLLMTNPGHIDPGYNGNLTLTVINMGREIFELKQGEIILSVVFFNMSIRPSVSYNDLKVGRRVRFRSKLDKYLLQRLSHDFLNVEERAKSQAALSVLRAQWVLPMTSVLAAACLTWLGTYVQSSDETDRRITRIEEKINAIG